MRNQWHIFLNAIMFFTRIPIPGQTPHSQSILDKSSGYFSLVGWLVGSLIFLFFTGAHYWVPMELAIAISMVGSLLLTGAFHEDGLADTCDGFGGGWTRDQTLAIMKDSRLGTYGAAGLGSVLLIKWLCLSRVPTDLILATFITGHATSRFAATLLIRFSNYARADAQRQSKPLAKNMGNGSLFLSIFFGLAPFALFGDLRFCLALIPVSLVTLVMTNLFHKRLDGYTGDCLGAVQQVTEVCIYITVVSISWKYMS